MFYDYINEMCDRMDRHYNLPHFEIVFFYNVYCSYTVKLLSKQLQKKQT